MKVIKHGRMLGKCEHQGHTWGSALAKYLQCAGDVIEVPEMKVVLAELSKGRDVEYNGVVLTPGK